MNVRNYVAGKKSGVNSAPRRVEYAGLRPCLQEVDWPLSQRSAVLGPRVKNSVIIVTSKNHSERLTKTLDGWASSEIDTILLDDSTTEAERDRNLRLAKRASVVYHGQQAQRRTLANIPRSLRTGLVSPLGSRGWTLGTCRNYSLLLALVRGYDGVLLVDDDILPTGRLLARSSLALLEEFEFVGAHTEGFPDDSVVGHIARSVGVTQYDFITGQYLALRTGIRECFFPEVYNEDLIFLLLQAHLKGAARCGSIRQLTPRRQTLNPRRAMAQEAGEIHVEGLIQAKHREGASLLRSDRFWRGVRQFRESCIVELLDSLDEARVDAGIKPLRAALGVTRRLKPSAFARFYEEYELKKAQWVALQSSVSRSR